MPKSKQLKPLFFFICLSTIWTIDSIIFPITEDWDEDTFLLVGSRMAHAELPYTTTFENKPPLATFLHSLPFLFGITDPHLMRLITAILLGLCAFFISSTNLDSKRNWISQLVGIFFLSLYLILPAGKAWMTQINVILLFSICVSLAAKATTLKSYTFIILCSLIGCLPLVRTNWVLVCIILLAYILYSRKSNRIRLLGCISFMSPSFFVIILYSLSGNLNMLWKGIIALPIEISTDQGISLETSEYMVSLSSISFFLSLISLILRSKAKGKNAWDFDILLILITIAIVTAQILQFPDFSHHTLQIVPFLALSLLRVLDAIFLVTKNFAGNGTNQKLLRWISIITLPMLTLNLGQLGKLQMEWQREKIIVESVERRLGELSREGKVWALTDHYIYWRLGIKPFHPLVSHPSSIAKQAFINQFFKGETPQITLKNLLEMKPEIIVVNPDIGYLEGDMKEMLFAVLKNEYTADDNTGSFVWQRAKRN